MPRPYSRNNLIAGFFVLAAMILAVAMSVAVSGVQKRLVPTHPYTIRFSLLEGAPGLKNGSTVTLGGQQVGRVVGLEFTPAAKPDSVDVHVLINSSIALYTDAWAFLERPLLGSMSAINVSRVGGDPDPKTGAVAPRLAPGSVLRGVIAPPSFLAQAGYGPEQAQQFKAMVSQASKVVDRVDRLSEKFENQDYQKVSTAIDDVGSVTSQIRERVPEWTRRADSLMEKADDAAGQLKQTVTDADETIKNARAAIDANRPTLDRIVANIDDAVKTINQESIPIFNDALKTAREGAASFSEGGHRFNALVQEQTPNLRDTLANLRLASDQIKLTMIEVRRNPWRLLYTPKTKELESELFYDAARTYADAVSDLRAASEALEVTSREGSPNAVDRETIQHITQRLDDAFKRYQTAEQELLRQMSQKR
jgi:ABC-type transporter Mla subunit MlaD